jgi:hypothetical protein
MITLFQFHVQQNYIKCFARAGNPLDPMEKPDIEEIYFIPKLRSRIIVNLEPHKRSNIPSSITILADGALIMSVHRYNLIETGGEETDEPTPQPPLAYDVLFQWDGNEINFEELITYLADNTALITNL